MQSEKKPWKTFTLSENMSRRFVNAVKKNRGKHLRWMKTRAAVLSMQSEKNPWKTITLSENMSRCIVNAI